MRAISLTALRRIAIDAQGYATRSRAGSAAEVEATIRRLSCVQLDSISAVERSHRIALASRVGAYKRGVVPRLLERGRVFEYWAHEACLLPVEEWPLFVAQMRGGGRRWYGDVGETHPHLADEILAEIRARGPLGSRHFEGTSEGGMWNWKPAKAMLDRLWNHGDLVIAGRQGFQRLYDLPERVIPKAILDAPVPDDDARLRALAEKAVSARGALTESGIVEHWRLRGGTKAHPTRRRRTRRRGRTRARAVDDGGAPVLLPAGADLAPAAPSAAVLLSPFDNLLWDRPFARRVLGFDHLIEVYKKEHERRYGYYVLPLLLARSHRRPGRPEVRAGRRRACREVVPSRAGSPRLGSARRCLRPRARPTAARVRARDRPPRLGRGAATRIPRWTSRRAPSTSARSPTRQPGR